MKPDLVMELQALESTVCKEIHVIAVRRIGRCRDGEQR